MSEDNGVAMTTYLEREEQREPTQHVFRDLGHTVWVYAEANVAIQHSLKIASEAVQDTSVRYVESQFRRAGVMAVRQRKPCSKANVSENVIGTRRKTRGKGVP